MLFADEKANDSDARARGTPIGGRGMGSVRGVLSLMSDMFGSRRSRRAFVGAAALAALAFAGFLPVAAVAGGDGDNQAEWPQSYEASPQMAVGRESTPILSPATVDATQAAIQRYQDIVAKGGWNAAPAGPALKIGSKGPRVQALRDRLVASGDLDPIAGAGAVYDSYVEAAVKRFQVRHGLKQTGVVDEEVYAELNVPAAARLQQLETNIVRLKAFSGDLGSRFVVVNIPAASVETVEGGVV